MPRAAFSGERWTPPPRRYSGPENSTAKQSQSADHLARILTTLYAIVFAVTARTFALRVVAAALVASVAPAETRWSFPNQITPILTFGGCNQTACHGGPVGKAGFKLSLFGYQPEDDHAA